MTIKNDIHDDFYNFYGIQNYNYWLSLNCWTFLQAAYIICGLEPEKFGMEHIKKMRNGYVFVVKDFSYISFRAALDEEEGVTEIAFAYNTFLKLSKTYEMVSHAGKTNDLICKTEGNDNFGYTEYVAATSLLEWAYSAGFDLPAPIKKRLNKGDEDFLAKNLPFMNPDHKYYAEELAIAVAAWLAIYQKEGPKKKSGHKDQIKKWLEKNYEHKKLSDGALNRIATVVNPNKKGGAPSSEI